MTKSRTTPTLPPQETVASPAPDPQPENPQLASDERALLRQYQTIMEAAGYAIFTLSSDGKITHVSASIKALTGYSPAELVGKHYTELVHPDWHTRVERQYGSPASISEYESTLQVQIITASRWQRWVELTVVMAEDGTYQAIVRDISELKRTQEQLAENVRQLTTLHEFEEELADKLDLDYVLSMALDAAMRLSGADAGYIALKEEDGLLHVAKLLGDHSAEIANENLRLGRGAVSRIIRRREPELIADVSADPDYIVNRPRTRAQITIPLITQDNLVGALNLESNRAGVFTPERFEFVELIAGRISQAVDNARLYRQVATQLTQLRELYRQVSNLEQIKTDMIRIASHDLRNPLFVILGHLEMLRWDSAPSRPLDNGRAAEAAEVQRATEVQRINEHLVLMEKSARQMQKITTDILSLERIEHAAQDDTSVVFDLRQLVEQVCNDHMAQAAMLSRFMNVNLPDDEFPVRADPAQLREAVGNLVGNAIKYTRSGGQISVKLSTEGAKVVFEVEDNGIGIPEDQQARLFQPFYRARTTETEKIEGTGLGLHLVKNIIERHGGSMRFKSVYGQGSTFGFALRMAPDV